MNVIKKKLKKFYEVHVKHDPKVIAYYKFLENGGEALRTNYPLTNDSIVIDVGGYFGDYAADIVDKFNCKVDAFEPVPEYAQKIRTRFASNSNVRVIQAGFGAVDKEELISVVGLGSSVFDIGTEDVVKEKIKIISAIDYLQEKNYREIGLMKINIEGGEYELLNSLLDHPDLIDKIKYFQIQFHDFVPNAISMRAEIQHRLSNTHKIMWDYPFIWESWERTS